MTLLRQYLNMKRVLTRDARRLLDGPHAAFLLGEPGAGSARGRARCMLDGPHMAFLLGEPGDGIARGPGEVIKCEPDAT
jgi:hypothetical protein